MSFLAPLYIAGLAALSLPILFHLIRRTPKGQTPFSSLMFLSPSPPRVTRRSRLENVFLLLLRATALALLAFAFARPFLRDAEALNITEPPGRRVVIAVDTGASMRREDLWRQAVAEAEKVAAQAKPADQVALVTFADRPTTAVNFKTWREAPPAGRAALVKSGLTATSVGYGSSYTGDALIAAAELLTDVADVAPGAADAPREIVLVSDLKEGGSLTSLQGFAWPKGVTLEVRQVKPKSPTNAGLHPAGDADESTAAADDDRLRVRVSNVAASTKEKFQLQWSTAAGPIAAVEPTSVHVPPGESRVVRVKRPAAAAVADRLMLSGDDHDFDDVLYLAPQHKQEVVVAYYGIDKADDAQGSLYFLRRALADTRRRTIRVVPVPPGEALAPADRELLRLAIVDRMPPAEQVESLKKYAARDGVVLIALNDADPALAQTFLDVPKLEVAEAKSRDFALLGELTFSHPLFAPFADPRFSDFTKIHFWKHRSLKLPDDAKGIAVLARFDDGDPAVLERNVESGTIVVWTSGWRPADGQLALSSKFVPLLSALIDLRGEAESEQTQFTVGDAIADGSQKRELDRPGVLEIAGRKIAVNLAADESRTAPAAIESLEEYGVTLGGEAARKVEAERKRQLQIAELENRQKLWRWLIFGVLGLVVAETALAGHLTRRQTTVEP